MHSFRAPACRCRMIPALYLIAAAVWCLAAHAEDPPPGKSAIDPSLEEFFESKVRPILVGHCLECHGAEKSKGSLRLDARAAMLKGGEAGPVIVPGKPAESALIEAIGYHGDVQMPPKGKLKDDEIAALTEWVKRGAPWPEPRRPKTTGTTAPTPPSAVTTSPSLAQVHDRSLWSLQPVRNPVAPTVIDQKWQRSRIDRFILAKLEQSGLSPSPQAPRNVLVRRAYFDLIGLPPAPEEVDDFVRDDAPDAFAKVVDRLLASPQYGERWGRHWLDVARYGEDQAHAFQPRLYPYGFRYRDWVSGALNHGMPFDQFVVEQIAGDLIDGPGRQDRLAALGFFACGPVYYGDGKKLDQYADRIDTLTRGFLGLTVACARCHDHKYDPIPTTDYYALEGVFASTDYLEAPDGTKEQIGAYDQGQAAIKAKDAEITAFLKAEAARLNRKVSNDQLKQFEKSLPAESLKKIASLRAEAARLKKAAPPKYPVIHTLADASSPTNMPVLVRGNPDAPGAKVARRFLAVLGGERSPFGQGSGRLELARAIASAENPLTARLVVNRIWQHHFGQGLVATASNFGNLGEKPSHPELLDWLAHRLSASGWSLKALHRQIMLSAVYQQSSRYDEHHFGRDPGNALLWRISRRRLDVEAWRDAMLKVAGRLDQRIGGPSVSLDAATNARRTLYAAISRHDLASLLRLFDFPDPNITSGGRPQTTVPLQELFVLNSEFMNANARAFAARLGGARSPGQDDSERIRLSYRILFGREPTENERLIGLAFVKSGSLECWQHYAQALLATNEFMFVD
jgi:mono/diheme cytochrome c family protein